MWSVLSVRVPKMCGTTFSLGQLARVVSRGSRRSVHAAVAYVQTCGLADSRTSINKAAERCACHDRIRTASSPEFSCVHLPRRTADAKYHYGEEGYIYVGRKARVTGCGE